MRVASPSVNIFAVVCRQRRIALLRHLPTRRIVSVSTRAMQRAMAPPAHTERALTSSGVNPNWGPMIVVAAQSAAVISALRIVEHLYPLKTAARCLSGGSSAVVSVTHVT